MVDITQVEFALDWRYQRVAGEGQVRIGGEDHAVGAAVHAAVITETGVNLGVELSRFGFGQRLTFGVSVEIAGGIFAFGRQAQVIGFDGKGIFACARSHAEILQAIRLQSVAIESDRIVMAANFGAERDRFDVEEADVRNFVTVHRSTDLVRAFASDDRLDCLGQGDRHRRRKLGDVYIARPIGVDGVARTSIPLRCTRQRQRSTDCYRVANIVLIVAI